MREISTTVTAGQGSEKHNHDLEYRQKLSHVHERENGIIELIPYRDYRTQINAMAKPYIDAYNQKQQGRYQAAWDRYNAGEIKTKPRKSNYKPLSYDYYNDHLNDTYHNRKTGQEELLPMWRSIIIGLGDKADRAEGRITEDEAVKIFSATVDAFQHDFPHLKLLGATIHLDEDGFYHCHIDYKPFYDHDIGQGLGVGIGLDSALEDMGYRPEQSIINGRDKAPLLFNAMRNQIYRDVEAAMSKHRIRLQYGVSATKEPNKDSSHNQKLEHWQATQDAARSMQHQKNVALDVISQDTVSPEGLKSAMEAIENLDQALDEVQTSKKSTFRNGYIVEFGLFDQLRSLLQSFRETIAHLLHKLDVALQNAEFYMDKSDELEAKISDIADLQADRDRYKDKYFRTERARQLLEKEVAKKDQFMSKIRLKDNRTALDVYNEQQAEASKSGYKR